MFKDEVKRISAEFINEAAMSPKLLEDMAAMEKYMAESYSNRTFIELLQNADDALSTRIYVLEDNNNIYFANNGKPFDENDLLAICRSGTSNKERGKSIGYRGIGFKSTTQISNEILIFSNGVCFSFSKQLCSKILNKDESLIPTVRIPILVEKVDVSIFSQVEKLNSLGYSTIFVFSKAKTDVFIEELKEITSGYFIFLNNIGECKINTKTQDNTIIIDRICHFDNKNITITNKNIKEEWLVVNSQKSSVAFKIDNNKIVPCKENEAVYHSYLPTIDKMIYPCKINADFSTDPSRKHITYDDKTTETIDSAALLLFDIICDTFNRSDNPMYLNILDIFMSTMSFSKTNIALDKKLKSLLTSKKWLKLNNNDRISAKDYKLLPSKYSVSDIMAIRKESDIVQQQSLHIDVYNNLNLVDAFLGKYSEITFSNTEIVSILENKEFSKIINIETHGRLITNVIKESKQQNTFSNHKISINNILIPTKEYGLKSIKDIQKNKLTVSNSIAKNIKETLIPTEIAWLKKETGITDSSLQIESHKETKPKEETIISTVKVKPFLTKWRNAEQKCVEIEKSFGNNATDVSVRNEGYDVISVTQDGLTRYIEVKSVKKDWSFALTNNEYTSASQHGENYYICLICENTNTIEVKYIQNPLANATFEKRIKQWEWACFDFSATELKFDVK